jgi:hypothetical protein
MGRFVLVESEIVDGKKCIAQEDEPPGLLPETAV